MEGINIPNAIIVQVICREKVHHNFTVLEGLLLVYGLHLSFDGQYRVFISNAWLGNPLILTLVIYLYSFHQEVSLTVNCQVTVHQNTLYSPNDVLSDYTQVDS